MGIINVTPDSFSDGGQMLHPADAIAAGLEMVRNGAAVIDIGGESTRPGADLLSPVEEQSRVLPVIYGLRDAGATLSVDTRNAVTMAAALDAGATVINDVSALTHDPEALALVAERRAPVILMHMRGTPQTMGAFAIYADVVSEIVDELCDRIERAVAGGVARCNIAVDPGFGFAKNAEQNVILLRGLRQLNVLGRPIVAGLSRKRFLGAIAGQPAAGERDAESLTAGLFAVAQGASILRVHNVDATVKSLRIWQALSA